MNPQAEIEHEEKRPHLAPCALPITLLAILAFGCASGSGGRESVDEGDFPTEREIERIENAPLPETVFHTDLRQVREWRLEAAVPKRIEARRWVGRNDWGKLLGGALETTGGQAVSTQAMHCVASELARFAVARGGRPDASVHRFIVAACNASVANVSFRSLQGLGSIITVGETVLLARLVRPGLPSDTARLYGVTATC